MMTDNEAERYRLRYDLLEGYYLADAYFGGDAEARDQVLTLIDKALLSGKPAAMQKALSRVTVAMLGPTEGGGLSG